MGFRAMSKAEVRDAPWKLGAKAMAELARATKDRALNFMVSEEC